MAASSTTFLLRIACLAPLFYAGVVCSRCTGDCPCELGATCDFAVNASTTLHVVYQLNQTTENEVSVYICKVVDLASLKDLTWGPAVRLTR